MVIACGDGPVSQFGSRDVRDRKRLPVKASSGSTRRSMSCKELEDEERMESARAMFSFTSPNRGEN